MTIPKFELIAAPYTPFHKDGSLAPEMIPLMADGLTASEIQGAFVGGTTGEWCSMTLDERMDVFEVWSQTRNDLKRIFHVGHHCQQDAITLAKHAAKVGCDAIAGVAPSFFKPSSPRDLAQYFAPIAAAGDGLPIYLYHIPGFTGCKLSAYEQIEACAKEIPSFAGLKLSEPDLMGFGRCISTFADRYEVFWGVDELLISALPWGAKSAVGSTYNYAAPIYHRMIDKYFLGDHAGALQEANRGRRLIEILLEFGIVQAGKVLMSLRGVDCGPTRLPLAPLTASARDELLSRVEAENLLDDISSPCPKTNGAVTFTKAGSS